MTWAGGGHCQNEVKLQRERERFPDLCQLHIPWRQPSVPKCAEVPDFLNDVTEFIPWQSFRHMRSVFTALASGTLWILWIYEETKETKDVGNGCEQIPLPHVPRVSKALISTTAQGLSAEVFCKVLLKFYHISNCQIRKLEEPMVKWWFPASATFSKSKLKTSSMPSVHPSWCWVLL